MKKSTVLLAMCLLFALESFAQVVSEQNPLVGDGTHFWDCSGGACDSRTLQPWNFDKYRYAPEYAPMDPNDYGGPSEHG